jgi:hypothetical protein
MHVTTLATALMKLAGVKLARIAAAPEIQDQVDTHFASADPKKWKEFRRRLRDKGFAAAVRRDERSDAKLKRFTDLVGRHVSLKDPGIPVEGSEGKKYRVKYHADITRYSCSCPHWTYKLAPSPEGGDCRHIEQVRGAEKRASVTVTLPKAVQNLLSAGWVHRQTEKNKDKAYKARSARKAYHEIVPRELQPSLFQR